MTSSSRIQVPAERSVLPWLGPALLAVVAGILSHQLLFRPIVGLADNGDFAKITQPLGLRLADAPPPAERYFQFVWRRYRFGPVVPQPNQSSEILLARVATTLAKLFSGGRAFDLRWIGAVHAAAILGAAAVVWRESASLPLLARAAAFGFAALAFTDAGYVAPLDSFYAQAGSLVYLLWTIAAGIAAARRPGRAAPLAGYFAAAALFVASKPQEAFQAIPVALFGLWLAFRGARAVRVLGAALSAILLAGGAAIVRGTHWTNREGALYKMIFYELLPDSPDPAADVRAFGLPPADLRFSGTTNYPPDSPYRDPAVRARIESIGYGGLLRFYGSHPARLRRELARDAWAGGELCSAFGNFEKSAGFRPGARTAAYTAWERLRRRALPVAGTLLLALFAGNAALAAVGRLPAAARAGIGALVLSGAIAYGVCALASAHIEIVRKLYVFHAITDVLIAADLAAAGAAVARRA